jgi:hypothetical protein
VGADRSLRQDESEESLMSKSMITRLFVGSLLALIGSVVLLVVALGMAFAQDIFIMSGPDVVGIRSGPFAWAMIALAGPAVLVILGAALAQFVAWILAVLNAAGLPDKTWLIILLVTGLLSFGLVGMVVYVIAAPDTKPIPPQRPALRPPQSPGPLPPVIGPPVPTAAESRNSERFEAPAGAGGMEALAGTSPTMEQR